MRIAITVKQLGKKRAYVDKMHINIQGSFNTPYTLGQILQAVVYQQVEAFNNNREEKSLLTFLREGRSNTTPELGRLKFGHTYNTNTVDPEKAQEVVLQGFNDGLIAVFLDDEQLETIDHTVTLNEESVFTFIRLTFLAGSIW